MENNPLVGAIVGLVAVSSIYIWQSHKFNKLQKTLLLLCFVFPPLQWVMIFIVIYYNEHKAENTPEKTSVKTLVEAKTKLNTSIDNLKYLKEKGILTQEEYISKVEKIETEKTEQELKNSIEYIQLKSLFDSNILTKEEFDNKVKTLIEKKSLTNIERNDSSDSEFILNTDLDEEKYIPKVIEKKNNFLPYFIVAVILVAIASQINWNEVTDLIKHKNEKVFVEPAIDTTAVSLNNHNNTNNEPVINYLKKYVYLIITTEEPRLVHNTGIYIPSGNPLIPNTHTEDMDYVVYDKNTYTTEIEEIPDYNEDVKYKLLDKAEYDVKQKINRGSNFQMDLFLKCKDEEKRNSLKENYSKIADRQIYTFDSYAEASLDKHKNTNKINQKIELGNYNVIENTEERVYFYNKPDNSFRGKGYLIGGDLVYVEEIENDFGYVNFTNQKGLNSKGWVKMKFLVQNK
ncbi:SHOCT domain-containing protein [Flavobacterium sp. ZS1P14]|uniref:SHOCT domain-containing protein n=1 Tax=Flavobacterium sp. ZS1P14 TaxID=3401729 RepID=UPI003AAC6CBB